MPRQVNTLYLVPHAHTDVGYSHDPVVTLELHNRFLDRAILLCEHTRGFPEGSRFRWTVEVFSCVLRWWEQRGESARARLRECLERGEIDIGARYLNGTELYSPEDVAWEATELERMVALTGYRPASAIQNDVNGFPLAFARSLASAGVSTVMMGLNTTMGHSPFPRCSGFLWELGDDRRMLVWNGWIYNRIKTFCHLDELAEKFHGAADAFLASLPEGYPYDFAVTSATIGDNIGPFVSLPDQVRNFNERSGGLQLRIATFRGIAERLQRSGVPLPSHGGQWPDFWTFGEGSMPQLVGMVRRAQRRLRLVEQFRARGWADESGGTLDRDLARKALAYACEHTYDSHSSSGETCGSSDSLRQKAQVIHDAAVAESASMVLLRDHLTAMAADKPKQPVSVLLANPHDHALGLDYLTDRKGMLAFATSRQPEHLFQFDREPTYEALGRSATFGCRNIAAPAGAITCIPMEPLAAPACEGLATDSPAVVLQTAGDTLRLGRQRDASEALAPLSWQPAEGVEALGSLGPFPPFALIEERPVGKFQISGMQGMDPADAGWNPDLSFTREPLVAEISRIERRTAGPVHDVNIQYAHVFRRAQTYRLDERAPGTLDVEASFRFDVDPGLRAYYYALPLALPGTGDCEYWVDNCGVWFRAGQDQLPGTCNSFYQAYRGVAVSRGGATLYIASPDMPLFQFGNLTFGQLPSQPLQRRNPFVALWLYNNYWGTNYPSYSPGLVRMRFRLQWRREAFSETTARQLDETFDGEYITHPVA